MLNWVFLFLFYLAKDANVHERPTPPPQGGNPTVRVRVSVSVRLTARFNAFPWGLRQIHVSISAKNANGQIKEKKAVSDGRVEMLKKKKTS